ncbi:acyl carrier protein [Clostridium senegalense]|uniref:acyl carrier protein n=1 Tax=Clostridium senegalense TaxID=1465809 RepID=UPI000288B3BB|nr:acyl carrier protein [Clostridium senegalense]
MVFEKIKKVVAEQVSIDESEIKLQSTFNEELGLDSLELFEIVIALEDEFNIEIPNEELEGIANVQGLVSYIEEKIK